LLVVGALKYAPNMRRHSLSLGLLLAVLGSACSSDAGDDDNGCAPDDQDGVVGGTTKVLLNVSDTGYAVGGVKSGSTQPNIAVQNSSSVTLTITNVGSTPHGFQIACIPTELPAGCPQESCFPDNTSIDAIEPGDSVTVTFDTPAVEGAYAFTSDQPGDEALLGQFVLM
jgi:FtsP/CotA-like multicopper oxidase with cupredoxin domain